jgi:hypothetical protein
MQDALLVKVLQPVKDLRRKGLRDILAESAVFPNAATDGTTWDVFKEATRHISVESHSCHAHNPHAEELGRLFEAQILHDVRMVKIL